MTNVESTPFDTTPVFDQGTQELAVRKSWKPTKKWFAALVTSASGILLSVIESGEFGATEESALKVAIAALVVAYLFPNADTPGGVPVK